MFVVVASDWDDSEMEEQTLAQLRQGVSQEPAMPVAMTGKGSNVTDNFFHSIF